MEYSRFASSPLATPSRHDPRIALATRMSVRIPRVNLLVVGPDETVEHALDLIRGELMQAGGDVPSAATAEWQPGKPFILPSPSLPAMLVLRRVDSLGYVDQRLLVEWLERATRCQVISTAPSSLMPLVDKGVFLQTLYYRLNTVYMDLTNRRQPPWDW